MDIPPLLISIRAMVDEIYTHYILGPKENNYRQKLMDMMANLELAHHMLSKLALSTSDQAALERDGVTWVKLFESSRADYTKLTHHVTKAAR